ncbi:MAG: hypothetical protein HRU29_04955 [Rhizobiales bacterium]|nr:hypothetical protein [Hyphomicrobiales bacterium]NRB13733.1 hypothetical protein [Hyphomicrobiales bacterium]
MTYFWVIFVSILPIAAFYIVQGTIRPMLIPKAEIRLIAAKLIKEHGLNAYEFAEIAEERAWRYSRIYDQGKWKRIRQEIAQQLSQEHT